MADRGGARGGAAGARGGGFGSRGDRGGDRGRGRGRRGPRRGGNKSEEKEWQPVTKLGRLVKAGKIKSMEEIYLHSLPIKEYQIVDFFLPKLKDEVMKVSFRYFLLEIQAKIGSAVCWISGDTAANDTTRNADQTRTETNTCRTAYSIQGRSGHWRFRRSRRTRHQDVKRSRDRHSCSHHHCQTLRRPHPPVRVGSILS